MDSHLRPKPLVLTEGKADAQVMRAVLSKLVGPQVIGTLPDRDEDWDGWTGAVDWYLQHSALGGTRLLLMLDLDAAPTTAEALARVTGHRDGKGRQVTGEACVFAGLPGDPVASTWAITQFTLDDHVLKLIASPDVYAALERKERRIKEPYDKVMEKLRRFKKLMDEQGMAITEAKRYLELLRGISGLVLGPGAFAARVVQVASPEQVEQAFGQLVRSVQAVLTRDAAAPFPARG